MEVAEHLRKTVAAVTVTHDGGVVTMTISIGIAEVQGESLTEVMKAADDALYLAKSEGRDRVVAARPSVAATAHAASSLSI